MTTIGSPSRAAAAGWIAAPSLQAVIIPLAFSALNSGLGAHALADCAEGVAFQTLRDMAVLAIATPDHIRRRDDASPDRRRRSLRHALQAVRRLPRRSVFGVDPDVSIMTRSFR